MSAIETQQGMPSWFVTFLGCLEQGRADERLFRYLDEFLEWYARLHAPAQPPGVEHALEMFTETGLRRRFEEFVDQLVIANPNNYEKLFPANLSVERAKVRYRLLIRTFHPDRGERSEAWLTFRAERVNNAYQAYLETEAATELSRSATVKFEPVNTTHASAGKPSPKRRLTFRYSREALRRLFGDPEVLQRRIIWSLTAVAIAVVLMLLVSVLGS